VNSKATIKKLIFGTVTLLAIHTITYFLFAHKLLKDKLMGDWFGALSHSSDSVFVRDFYASDCFVSDPWTYYSHHLANNQDEVKKKLKVNFVKFQDKKDFRWNNAEENNYRLVYHTWTQYAPPWTIYGLFGSTQKEELRINRKDLYEREIKYQWVLFFWIKTFERIKTP
jgi:hypothetical protein